MQRYRNKRRLFEIGHAQGRSFDDASLGKYSHSSSSAQRNCEAAHDVPYVVMYTRDGHRIKSTGLDRRGTLKVAAHVHEQRATKDTSPIQTPSVPHLKLSHPLPPLAIVYSVNNP